MEQAPNQVQSKANDAQIVADYAESPLCCGRIKVHGWDAVELKRLLPDAVNIPGNVCFAVSCIAGAKPQSVMCLAEVQTGHGHTSRRHCMFCKTVRARNGGIARHAPKTLACALYTVICTVTSEVFLSM